MHLKQLQKYKYWENKYLGVYLDSKKIQVQEVLKVQAQLNLIVIENIYIIYLFFKIL
jgi:hypothetical protein